MAPPRSAPLAPALLFDRLADHDPAVPYEAPPWQALDGEALRASVLRELSDLLNTRSPFTGAELHERGRTTLEYGVPDLSAARPACAATQAGVAARIQAAIAAYEPRLRQPEVIVEPVVGRPMQLLAHVRGMLEGSPHFPVRFAIPMGAPAGRPR